jgi:hypothetical protein
MVGLAAPNNSIFLKKNQQFTYYFYNSSELFSRDVRYPPRTDVPGDANRIAAAPIIPYEGLEHWRLACEDTPKIVVVRRQVVTY